MKPKIISFSLCPFVQRSRIVLEEKGVDYDIECIDLRSPPSWFVEISPLRQVPVLVLGDQAVFDSVVINELLDEIFPIKLHPENVFCKAMNRSWIEYASKITQNAHWMAVSKTREEYCKKLEELREGFNRLESVLESQKYFNGEQFSLVDATYAPVFTRLSLIERKGAEILPPVSYPKVEKWRGNLEQRQSVADSVESTFKREYLYYLESEQSYLLSKIVDNENYFEEEVR
ncbi:MAG: glutathione S-transferase family protein [Candidatus Thiodiazotropha sp.]